MVQMLRILGKRGRITIPYEIRQRVGFKYNDVLSFTETADGRSVVVRREKICDNCKGAQPVVRNDEVTLFDFLNNLSPEQQRAALVHLSVKWAEKQTNDNVLFDNPIIFFVESASYQIVKGKYCNMVIPKYRFGEIQIKSTIHAIFNKTERFINSCRDLDELSKEEKVHNYLINNVVYDYDFKQSSFECVGPLLFGHGVCEGISKAAKLLMDLLDIHSLIVIGKSTQNVSNTDLHAWNIVKINGNYSHLDITFDITLMTWNVIRYDYFNLSDEEILLDHTILTKNIPRCSSSNSYYKMNNLIIYMQKDFNSYFKTHLSNGNKDVVFKLPNTKNFETAKNKVFNLTDNYLSNNYKGYINYQFSMNEAQAVFHLHILD